MHTLLFSFPAASYNKVRLISCHSHVWGFTAFMHVEGVRTHFPHFIHTHLASAATALQSLEKRKMGENLEILDQMYTELLKV